MGKFRVFFGLLWIVAIATLSFATPVAAQGQERANESYTWVSYNVINGSQGAYAKIDDSGADTVRFTQDKENPSQFVATVSGDECDATITLTISEDNASNTSVSSSGDCPAAADLDSTARINGAQRAVSLAQSEETQIERLYTAKECSSLRGDERRECDEEAKKVITETKATCFAEHNYREHITRADAYLDCLATTFDVERPSPDKEVEAPEAPTGCQIHNGWMMCQIVEFIAQLTDHTFSLLEPFLIIEPLKEEVSNGKESSTYTAWKNIRDVANILLAIGLMYVIFSHLTGIGLSAYHIKKGLPRLIVASLLINISFFTSALLIDVSNITGQTAQDATKYFSRGVTSQSDIFKDWQTTSNRIMSITATDADFNQKVAGIDKDAETEEDEENEENAPPEETAAETDPDAWVDEEEDTTMIINGQTITGMAVLYANLAILLPVMVVALFAAFAALLILLFRQAIVLILVVISPIAFAAIMLPGTKGWYDKWQSTLIQLLMMYPIVALIYASSLIAAEIIRESAANNGHTLMAIFSLGIQMIPLMIVPMLLKFSGGVVNKFAGTVQGATSAPRRAIMQKAKDKGRMAQDMRGARFQAGRMGPGGAIPFIPKKFKGATTEMSALLPGNAARSWKKGRDFKAAQVDEDFKRTMAENMEQQLSGIDNKSLVAAMKAEADEELFNMDLGNIRATIAMFEHQGLQQADYMAIATTGAFGNGKKASEIEQRAAARLAMAGATPDEGRELLRVAGEGALPSLVAKDIADEANKAGLSKQSFEISQSHIGAVRGGNADEEAALVKGINSRRLSPAQAPKQHYTVLIQVRKVLAENPNVEPEARVQFAKTIVQGLASESRSSANEDTLEASMGIIGDAIDRGDINFSDVAEIFGQGSKGDEAENYKLLLKQLVKEGKLDMDAAMQHTGFADKLRQRDDIADGIKQGALEGLAGANETIVPGTLNSNTLGFYEEVIAFGYSNPDTLNPVHAQAMESFVGGVRGTLNNPSARPEDAAAAASLVDRYDAFIRQPGGRT